MSRKSRYFQTARRAQQSPASPSEEELETLLVLLTKNQVRALEIWSGSRKGGDKDQFIREAVTKALEKVGIPPEDTVFMDFLDHSGLSKG